MKFKLGTNKKPLKVRTKRPIYRLPLGAYTLAALVLVQFPHPLRAAATLEPPEPSNARDARKLGWTIVLGSVVIEEDAGEAQRLGTEALDRVHAKGKLPEAIMERRGRSIVLCFGNYDNPDADLAVKDLERIRAIEIEGARPYAKAYMAPPPDDALKGSLAEFDLRNVRLSARSPVGRAAGGGGGAAPGKSATLYTLQVGVYGNPDGSAPKPDDLKEFRAAAEKAAAQLRREGELAFYYHAATLSSVTVGLFNADELVSKDPRAMPGQTVDTPELAMLRKLHPNNLLNGQGIVIKHAEPDRKKPSDKAKELQPSFLVEVPR